MKLSNINAWEVVTYFWHADSRIFTFFTVEKLHYLFFFVAFILCCLMFSLLFFVFLCCVLFFLLCFCFSCCLFFVVCHFFFFGSCFLVFFLIFLYYGPAYVFDLYKHRILVPMGEAYLKITGPQMNAGALHSMRIYSFRFTAHCKGSPCFITRSIVLNNSKE